MTAEARLQDALMEHLPLYSRGERFDVPRLCKAMDCSRQALYKWFKANRLTVKAVDRLLEVANREDNLRYLTAHGRRAPVRSDFLMFV